MTHDLVTLEEARSQLEADMGKIRLQLDHARANVHATGEYADPKWFVSAQHALRCKGQAHQNLLREIATLKRQQKQTISLSFEKAFIAAARRRLSPDLWRALCDEAREAAMGTAE
jgi:hypothetical protein